MKELAPGVANVLFDTWLVSRAVHALIDEAVKASGLDADEFAVYSVLASGDAVTPSDLAQWMAAPPTTVSSYVKRFEKRGHVIRAPNPEDGRSYRLQLTDTGREIHRTAGELFAPTLAAVESALGSEAGGIHEQLLALRKTIDNLGASTESDR